MNKLFLHGKLKKQFGAEFELDARTPREMVHALCHQIDGFQEVMVAGTFRVVRKYNGTVLEIDEDLVELGMDNAELHITPALKGSGKGKGIGKILAGIALVGLTFVTGGAALLGTIGLSTGFVAATGVMMALGGLSMLLAPSPKGLDPNAKEDEKASFIFNGPVNVSEQGHPVPLAYGKILVGSIVISSDLVSDIYVAPGKTYNGAPSYYGYTSSGNGGSGGSGTPGEMFGAYPLSSRTMDDISRISRL